MLRIYKMITAVDAAILFNDQDIAAGFSEHTEIWLFPGQRKAHF